MDKTTDFFDTWLNSQREFIKNMMDLTTNVQSFFSNYGDKRSESPDAPEGFFNLYNSWIRTVGKSFDEIMKNFRGGAGKDSFSKIFSGADAYMKLYDSWAPIFKAIQENTFNAESIKELTDPSKYKEVIDKVFGFSSPGTFTELYGQGAKIVETWGSSAQTFMKPWIEAMQKNAESLPALLKGEPEPVLNAFHNFYNAFESTYGKTFKIPTVGKDREKIELMLRCLDRFNVYLAKNTEFQHKIYVTGQDAMENVIKAVAEKIKEGTEVKSYNEFFKIWTDLNEKAYYELFKTEEFSEIQGELLDSALAARRDFQTIMELSLEDYPIALRSEMDDVYKTIYELKKKVRNLEKKLNSK